MLVLTNKANICVFISYNKVFKITQYTQKYGSTMYLSLILTWLN